MRIPLSTYRIQLNRACPFKKVIESIDYFEKLGIGSLYLSPITKAVQNSQHGYDVIDYTVINPEIGTEEDLKTLADEAHKRGIGIIVDFVPDHMWIHTSDNKWWNDVLKQGKNSKYAPFFSIDWNHKIFLPILNESLEDTIKNHKLTLEENSIVYGSLKIPVKGKGFSNWAELLEHQAYRLGTWKEAAEKLNYRRFFDVSEFIGLQIEDPKVFEAVHAYLFSLINKGWIDGLRIDHIDGLKDPAGYLKKVKAQTGCYLIVEKILCGHEKLRHWAVEGTTGYESLNMLNQLFVSPTPRFKKIFQKFTGINKTASQIIFDSKMEIMQTIMHAEIKRSVKVYSEKETEEWIARFPVYRTYIYKGKSSKEDKAVLDEAHTPPKIRLKAESFQQITGPIMAKGYEDTSLYRYYPLSSLNEVGSNLNQWGLSLEEFHEANLERLEKWPYTIIATSTHDNKRSEDVRARINALSIHPTKWAAKLKKWGSHPFNPETAYLLYQTLLGTWPSTINQAYIQKITNYLIKASKEAKLYTSWVNPDIKYEQKLKENIKHLLTNSSFIHEMDLFAFPLIKEGTRISLSETVLKLTIPGIPDFYQGCEKENYDLVDPDNRHPVIFSESNNRKYLIIKALLNFRKKHPDLFLKGNYIPIKGEGIGFFRTYKHAELFVSVRRFGTHPLTIPRNFYGIYEDVFNGHMIELREDFISKKAFHVMFREYGAIRSQKMAPVSRSEPNKHR